MIFRPVVAGAGVPAASKKVGTQSYDALALVISFPAWICPGHRASVGMRTPPSQQSRLMPSNGPKLLKKSGVFGLIVLR